jgi:hypothetical protein
MSTEQQTPTGVRNVTTVRDAFFEVARRLKLTTIFGNPGSTEETWLKDFPDDSRGLPRGSLKSTRKDDSLS